MPKDNYEKWPNERHLLNPVENSLDRELILLCQEFEHFDNSKRQEIRKAISMDEIYTLLLFSKRATVFGIKKGQINYIKNGLSAIAMIESERCDYRDILVSLSFLYYGASKIGFNPDHILNDVAKLSEKNVSDLITGFVKRNKRDKDLRQVSGYQEIETDQGTGFIESGFKDFKPTKEIIKIAIEISNYLENDKYLPGIVQAATEIPPIWFSADNDKNIVKVLKSAKGVISVSSGLQKNKHLDSESQMLLIFIGEMQSDMDAELLLIKSQEQNNKDFYRLGINRNNLFCLVITRSIVHGVDAFETPETIKRFEKPINEIIDKYI